MGWFASFLYSQLFVKPPQPTKDFSGQTIIITGSNTGLGLEAARHVTRLGAALVILAVRNQVKGEIAKKSILASTGCAATNIEVWDLDMQSYPSIQAFCTKAGQLPRLDAVLENAGIMTKHFNMIAGYESTITTNVIGTFLLALGLLPKLRQSAAEYKTQVRLSFVTSDIHFLAKFPERHNKDIFASLNNEKSAKMAMERYSVSKLIQLLAVRELAAQVSHEPVLTTPAVIINCMTPGGCKSDFDRESTGFARFMGKIMYAVLARTTEVGSRTLVAGLAAGEESHGSYMADCHIAEYLTYRLRMRDANAAFRPGPMVRGSDGMALQKKIWDQLVIQLETIRPGISEDL
ncbi:Short chain dehydrogenase sol3 [Lachnellula cervina]|uniref:Short chain dehydrogenase sol3 n=1 Tax=Lachnellula cervina TaxID=1316786 RepID=A0A7D8Z0P4_9HELO|nr:Short chain dehydrogenase sol3 [Lachnellula cervina]